MKLNKLNDSVNVDMELVTAINAQNKPLILEQYIKQFNKPVKNVCFLVDKNSNKPKSITLDKLIQKTGINPFELDENIDVNGPELEALYQAGFMMGIKVTIDTPENISLEDFQSLYNKNLLIYSDYTLVKLVPKHLYSKSHRWIYYANAVKENKPNSGSMTCIPHSSQESVEIESSSEVMVNYLHAEIISPQEKFQALQTSTGQSLLFSIGTGGGLNLIKEDSGKSVSGWTKTDLSSVIIERDFSHDNTAVCDTFAVGQSAANGSFGIAMVITAQDGDHLYLSLNNSNTETYWANAPDWIKYKYDNPKTDIKPSRLDIVDILFCETRRGREYIVVDIVRDPTDKAELVRRFYIDVDTKTNYYWKLHNLAVDLETDKYTSCWGHRDKDSVDGLYTIGHIVDSPQFFYTPVIDVYSPEDTAPSTHFRLPSEVQPDAIASIKRQKDENSHLFTIGNDTLYYFSPSNHGKDATGKFAIKYPIMSDTRKLIAMSDSENKRITLWGLNGSKQVYYTSCDFSKLDNPAAWSLPVPILFGIKKISAYINCVDGGNTIFAAGNGHIQKITRSPHSSLWQTADITLPVQKGAKAISFDSYTTTIKLSTKQGQPCNKKELSLSASAPCSVYINGLYYVFNDRKIRLTTDELGIVTIVEPIKGLLNATTFTVETNESSLSIINPMDQAFSKLAALNTVDKLRSATIKQEDGTISPLIKEDVSYDSLKLAAASVEAITTCYQDVSNKTAAQLQSRSYQSSTASPFNAVEYTNQLASTNNINIFGVSIGDIFNWLKSGVEAVIQLVRNAAHDIWYFAVTIGDKIYHAVIDTVEAVFEAFEWVFDAIKVFVEDVIAFVKFLFEWDDIKRTKDVIHNLSRCFLDYQVQNIGTMKQQFNKEIDKVKEQIDEWSQYDSWSNNLGPIAAYPTDYKAEDPLKQHTAASLHLLHHFNNNIDNIDIVSVPQTANFCSNSLEKLIKELHNELKNSADDFNEVITNLWALIKDIHSLSLSDILKRLIGILANSVLSAASLVVSVLFDIMAFCMGSITDMLETKFHIPVISDILNLGSFSILDILSWISAVAYTVTYKITHNKAPFVDSEETNFLIHAENLEILQQGFNREASICSICDKPTAIINISDETKKGVFVAGRAIAGFTNYISVFISALEANNATGNKFGKYSAGLAIFNGAVTGVTNQLVPKHPIKNSAVKWVSNLTLILRMLSKGAFNSAIQDKFGAPDNLGIKILKPGDPRAAGSIVDAILVIPALACTAWHFYELSQLDESIDKTLAVIDEACNLETYVARVCYALAVNDPETETKELAVIVMAIAAAVASGLQVSESIIADQSNHYAESLSVIKTVINPGTNRLSEFKRLSAVS
ncbi:hypothetical protein [Moritella sp. 28]|uniref:hypothetical protein n=1 Tax=Moritella sp. 28 TaxID=2746232 RepID=UPI001BA87F3B|nr:hypothetical protein [Moritella sp. 28]QUM85075.1 hypothetical protein HWV02_11480 [Moritella sp. 28]